MSATPRTNAVMTRGVELGDFATVPADFARELETENAALKVALKDLFALMDEGWLIRDTSEDAKPGFAMRQLGPVQRLAKARKLLGSATTAEIPEVLEPGDLKD